MRSFHAAAAFAAAAVLLLIPAVSAHYTNEWAAQIAGGDAEAERVARELNCVVKGERDDYFGLPVVIFFLIAPSVLNNFCVY